MRIRIRECADASCGKVFEVSKRWKDQRFCSRKCANRTINERNMLLLYQVNVERHLGPEDYESTSAIPGSKEKVEVLRQRVERGEPLFHPGDVLTYECVRYSCVRADRQMKLDKYATCRTAS